MTYDVCGVPIAAVAPHEAVEAIIAAARESRPLEVHLCNAFTLSLVDSDPELRSCLSRADLNLPDGTPVAWLGRSHGTAGPVRGPGLVEACAEQGIGHGLRHFFLGGAPGVAERMSETLAERYPGLAIAGCHSPPFSPVDEWPMEELRDLISASGADLVWVGVGTPKQDYVVPRLTPLVQRPVVPVGAAFDFLAGTIASAPDWLHGTGLEWLHRLASDPRRLWRRYLVGNPRFVASAARHARRH